MFYEFLMLMQHLEAYTPVLVIVGVVCAGGLLVLWMRTSPTLAAMMAVSVASAAAFYWWHGMMGFGVLPSLTLALFMAVLVAAQLHTSTLRDLARGSGGPRGPRDSAAPQDVL